ncbi:MAG: M20/M25/M40 family metallo-hydrolase [Acidobacteria bacterium]|nr:MAG: M20/M25/M40 family metallo-hydrolase [Acidobacteriota bacterium]
MNKRVWVGLLFLLTILSPACAPPSEDAGTVTVEFSADLLREHIETLSSDEFGGRAPGSPGEEKTVAYLRDRFGAYGLAPGNPDGTFIQNVPLVGITSESYVSLGRDGEEEELEGGVGYVAWTKRVVEEVSLDEELVFVGYGVVAPEYDWDDYKDVDVRGKVLVMLVNDPPVEGIFGDEAMTYYGRWTYKYEIAAEKGAAGAFVVHETVPAGYPWEVVSGSWTGEQFDLETEDKNMGRVAVEGWFSLEVAQSLFEKAGLDFDAQKQAARDRAFRPVALGTRVTATIENTMRNVDSANVVARLEGSEAPDEVVLYVAHWDHLGTIESMEGDNIFNGAYDNATGVAGLLELARVLGALDPAPRRSVVFVAVTAEEQGLLGSRYYAEHPLYPANKTVAAINMDGLNIWGRTSDITVVGLGQSELDDLAREVATGQGRIVRPDPEPEKGFYYRSDHFELAKVGIPSFYADVGISFEGKPEGWGEEQRAIYTAEDYHKPSDEIKDWYEFSGMIQDLELFLEMGKRLAGGDGWPEWSETSEFRARREASRE